MCRSKYLHIRCIITHHDYLRWPSTLDATVYHCQRGIVRRAFLLVISVDTSQQTAG